MFVFGFVTGLPSRIRMLGVGRSVRIPAQAVKSWVDLNMTIPHNAGSAGPAMRKVVSTYRENAKTEIRTVSTNEKTRLTGGSVTLMRAARELARVLELPTESRRKHFLAKLKLSAYQEKHWDEKPERSFEKLLHVYLNESQSRKRSANKDLVRSRTLLKFLLATASITGRHPVVGLTSTGGFSPG